MAETSHTTPLPSLFKLPVSSKTSGPAAMATPLPSSFNNSSKPTAASNASKHKFDLPKLRLEVRDLNHAGADAFLSAVSASKALATSVQSVLSLLYESPKSTGTTVPPTRSVTLILRSMGGVAYTTGSDLDSDHKEIHFSLDYISNIPASRLEHEIMGVLTHEMVHCYQYDAWGTCPGGFIEGIADWVRLNSDLSPPHWKKEASGKWDAGYQHTGYFLQYLEDRFGKGLIRRLNEKLRVEKYDEKKFWTETCGRPVEQLWHDYGKVLEDEKRKAEEEECVIVEKEDATVVDVGKPALAPDKTTSQEATATSPAQSTPLKENQLYTAPMHQTSLIDDTMISTTLDKDGWKPPPGSWEDNIVGIDACEDEDGKIYAFLTWNTGQKTRHPMRHVYKRCPQKMLRFYESHLVFRKNSE